jgi:hypothetical protein
MGLAMARRFTNDHRVLNRATWSALQASRMLLGWLVAHVVPPGAPMVLGADETVERRSGRPMTAQGCDRDAVRSTKKHVIRCCGLKWVVMMLLVPVPWARRVWAFPFLTALCRPVEQAKPRRHQTSVDGVRQMLLQVRRWLPGRPLGLVVEGGFAAVSLALAWVKSPVTMVSRLRWDAALYHRPALQSPGKRGPQPLKGKRQRSLQAWAARTDTAWETVEVDWYGGRRKKLWVVSHTALWHTRGLPPVDIRFVLVGDPEGKRRMEACFCTDLQATPVPILAWVVMRWSVEVTFEEGRALLGLATQRQWSDQSIARTTPVLLGLVALVTLLALQLSHDGRIPVPVTAWYHKAEPTFSACLSLLRHHLWRARYLVHSTPEAACRQFPQEALDLLIHGLSLAA